MWRDTSRQARFFGVDIRALFPLLLFALHIRLWTFIIAVISIVIFKIMERRQMDVPVTLRWIRSKFWGVRRPCIPDYLSRKNNRL